MKTDLADGRVRLNAAVFWNEIENMQREINTPGALGVAQILRNTANARMRGFEVEGRAFLSENTLLTGHVGYVDAEYRQIFSDLSGDGMVGPADFALSIPRVAPWTYGIGLYQDFPLEAFGGSVITGSVNYNFRDRNAYTDNNRGFFDAARIWDAALSWDVPDSGFTLTLYGKNLSNVATIGNDTQLPPAIPAGGVPVGGTFAPLNRGRVIGLELRVRN